MRHETCAVNLQNEDVVDHADFLTTDELHFSLMAHNINGKAHTFAFINVACLCEKFNVEGLALNVGGRLRMNVASHLLMATRVGPLPFLAIAAQFRETLGWSCPHANRRYMAEIRREGTTSTLCRASLASPCELADDGATRRGIAHCGMDGSTLFPFANRRASDKS